VTELTSSVRVATAPVDLTAAYAVRHAVFVVGQQVPAELERDTADESAIHVVAEAGGRVVGAGRLVVDGDVGVLGRLAVLPELRGIGLGVRLVHLIEQQATERGCRMIELHAQVPVRGFYERLGYRAHGEEYDEAGMPHISMRKIL
jgi:predicted GNAT family N-acyltransferase